MDSRTDELEDLLLDDPQKAQQQLHALVEDDDADAMVVLALGYFDGEFGKRDPEKALKLLERAASLDHVKAIHDLGCFRYYGYGFDPDFRDAGKAALLFERGSDLGHPPSQHFLALMILGEEGGSGGRERALRLMRAAASQGHQESIEYLESIDSDSTQRGAT